MWTRQTPASPSQERAALSQKRTSRSGNEGPKALIPLRGARGMRIALWAEASHADITQTCL